MLKHKIIKLQNNPEIKESLAAWFHEKWCVPLEAYLESMNMCLNSKAAVPQWYGVVDNNKIIAGLGVIENDFHNRKDLTPNVCALYVEDDYRHQKIAGALLDYVCKDMINQGIDTLYLITDHTTFYERYGWEYLCMVQGDGEPNMTRMYVRKTL